MKLTKKDKIEILIWVEALRSGLFSQTRFRLQDNLGYCCLGVACELFVKNKIFIHDNSNIIYGDVPFYQPDLKDGHWLYRIDKDYWGKTGKHLIELNDVDKLTFNEIADKIEETYLK